MNNPKVRHKTSTKVSNPLGYHISTHVMVGVSQNYACLQRLTCDDLISDLSQLETKLSHLHACLRRKAC
jgi:hypothetical protein